ncbi:MAG: hypothetical protein KAH20_03430, partial [Methylococcales bacterium]|nr:hypothetical protein [Methylococcales bacterium]
MKKIFSLIPFFFFNSAIANVEISADIEKNDLILSLSSDKGDIHKKGHIQFFIDADNDSKTGYSSGNISGADYLLEDNELYISTSNSDDWSWKYLLDIELYGKEMPFYMDRMIDLNNISINKKSTIKVGTYALTSKWVVVKNYHGSTMKKFTLGGSSSPEPTPEPT